MVEILLQIIAADEQGIRVWEIKNYTYYNIEHLSWRRNLASSLSF